MQSLVLVFLLLGASLGFLDQPLGYANRFKDVIFEYHASHSLLLVRDNIHKDCYLVRSNNLIETLFKTKQGRYLVEDDIYKQIQSQTDETKINLPQITRLFGDYLAKAECRKDVIFELKFTPPKTSSATTTQPTSTTTTTTTTTTMVTPPTTMTAT